MHVFIKLGCWLLVMAFTYTTDEAEFSWSSDLRKKFGDHISIPSNQLKYAREPSRGVVPTYFLAKHQSSLQAAAEHARSLSLFCAWLKNDGPSDGPLNGYLLASTVPPAMGFEEDRRSLFQ